MHLIHADDAFKTMVDYMTGAVGMNSQERTGLTGILISLFH